MTSLITSLYRKHEINSVYAPLIKREKVVMPITHNPTLAEMKAMYEQHEVIYRIESGKVIFSKARGKVFSKIIFKKKGWFYEKIHRNNQIPGNDGNENGFRNDGISQRLWIIRVCQALFAKND